MDEIALCMFSKFESFLDKLNTSLHFPAASKTNIIKRVIKKYRVEKTSIYC